ncbi:hypothetical protein HOD88_00675 [archaeon]|jgi:hypothetical protein|nr:hypothetical protein [archaeon]
MNKNTKISLIGGIILIVNLLLMFLVNNLGFQESFISVFPYFVFPSIAYLFLTFGFINKLKWNLALKIISTIIISAVLFIILWILMIYLAFAF